MEAKTAQKLQLQRHKSSPRVAHTASLPRSGRSPHSRGAILKGGSNTGAKKHRDRRLLGLLALTHLSTFQKAGCVSHSYTLRGAQGQRLYVTPATLVYILVQYLLLTKMSSCASFLIGVSALM